jgi:hypothetical protein
MAQTAILAPGLTAAQSADIVVTATTPALIAAYTTDNGGVIPNGFQLTVVQKTPNATYQPYYADKNKPVIISQDQLQIRLSTPGTYGVIRGVVNFNLGVSQDQ